MFQPREVAGFETFESEDEFRSALRDADLPAPVSVFGGYRRLIADLGDGRMVHGAQWHRNPGFAQADLAAEGRVLAAIHPHMHQIGIETPRVLETFRCVSRAGDPPRLLQVRTKVGGPTCEKMERNRKFDSRAFARSLGEAIAHLHTAPFTSLFPTPGYADPQRNMSPLPKEDEKGAKMLPLTGNLRKIFASVRNHFNDLTGNALKVFLHNDLDFRNVCVGRVTSTLTGMFDFEMAYVGPPAAEFVQIGLTNPKCPISPLLKAYNASTASQLPALTRSDIACADVVRMYAWVRNCSPEDGHMLTRSLLTYAEIRALEERAGPFISLPSAQSVGGGRGTVPNPGI